MRILTASSLAVLLVSPLVSPPAVPPATPPPFLLMWGTSGSGAGEFVGNKPRPLDVDRNGNVYVVDKVSSPTSMDRVQVFDSTGRFLRQFFAAHPDGRAEGLTVDNQGNVLLVNELCERVEKYDNAGNLLRMWGWGVYNGTPVHQVCAISCQCGIQGAGDGQLHSARGVDTDANGNVYVADRSNERVVKYNLQGTFLRAWGWGVRNGATEFQVCTLGCEAGIAGNGNGQFSRPTDIAVLGDTVYVVDWYNSRVQLFSRDGSYQGWFHVGGYPAGMDVAPGGDFYVSRFFDHSVTQFDSSGTQVAKWGTNGSGIGEFDNPWGVAVTADGHVFVADSNNHRVQKFGDPSYRTFKAELLKRKVPLLAFPR